MALRDPATMSDADLLAEARALQRVDDAEALRDPARLLHHLNPLGYRRRRHLTVISNAMARLVTPDPEQQVDRILIEVPPQTGKTVTAVVGGAFWWLANHPAHRVIIGSYNNTLAIDRGRDVRKLVELHGDRYGLRFERGAESAQDWRLCSGGGVKSIGVGGGIAGYPGDLAIIDDPHKNRAEANSLRYRDRAWNWLSADILSRLAPGAPLVLVMTPWHPDDLAARVIANQGRLEEGGKWLVIQMPALCTHPDRDPLGRSYGDPLPHPKVRSGDREAALRHWLVKREGSTVGDWSSLYLLDPKPVEGALLTRALLRERRCYTTPDGCCTDVRTAAVAVDPSGGGRDTAGIVGGYRGTDDRMYLTHDWSGVMASDQWARKACELAVEIDADRIIHETNFGGDMVTLAIRTAWDSLRRTELATYGGDQADPRYREQAKYARLCPRIVPVRARKNKLLRADPIAQQWIEDRIRTAAYLPELEEEWATWQPDHLDSPGRIDASVYLAYHLLPLPTAGTGGTTQGPSGSMPASTATPLDRGGGAGFGTSPFGALG